MVTASPAARVWLLVPPVFKVEPKAQFAGPGLRVSLAIQPSWTAFHGEGGSLSLSPQDPGSTACLSWMFSFGLWKWRADLPLPSTPGPLADTAKRPPPFQVAWGWIPASLDWPGLVGCLSLEPNGRRGLLDIIFLEVGGAGPREVGLQMHHTPRGWIKHLASLGLGKVGGAGEGCRAKP